MRVSERMVFESLVGHMQRQSATLLRIQERERFGQAALVLTQRQTHGALGFGGCGHQRGLLLTEECLGGERGLDFLEGGECVRGILFERLVVFGPRFFSIPSNQKFLL